MSQHPVKPLKTTSNTGFLSCATSKTIQHIPGGSDESAFKISCQKADKRAKDG